MLVLRIAMQMSALPAIPQCSAQSPQLPPQGAPRVVQPGVVDEVVDVDVLVVVVVVGHVPQSCGHVEQSSEGPQSPSPHRPRTARTKKWNADLPVTFTSASRKSTIHAMVGPPTKVVDDQLRDAVVQLQVSTVHPGAHPC
jgi:hypothetical protein